MSDFLEWTKSLFSNEKTLDISPRDFAIQYFSSPGFSERFQNSIPLIREYLKLNYDFLDNNYKSIAYGLATDPSHLSDTKLVQDEKYFMVGNGSYYDPLTNEVHILSDLDKQNWTDIYGYYDKDFVETHELGHVIPESIEPFYEKVWKDGTKSKSDHLEFYNFKYPEIYPILKENSYREYIKSLKEMLGKGRLSNYALAYLHDTDPSEVYADLLAFRRELYKHNIYDSRLANNPFTKKHLEKWKKLGIPIRLFKYFKDDLIILMMNTVADNGLQESDIQYAKQGRKLIPRKQYIK